MIRSSQARANICSLSAMPFTQEGFVVALDVKRTTVQAALTITLIAVILAFSGSYFQWLLHGETLAGGSDQIRLKEIVVRRGDTLWSLAKEHGPQDRDIRETVDRIRSLNDLDDPMIRPGTKLMIPVK